MSLYAEYLKEVESVLGIHILEKDYGYCTYRLFEKHLECYIEDLYVVPDKRKSGYSARLADEVTEIARSKGYKYLSTTVIPEYQKSTISLKTVLSYGFKLHRSEQNKIWFIKEIQCKQ